MSIGKWHETMIIPYPTLSEFGNNFSMLRKRTLATGTASTRNKRKREKDLL